MNQQFEQRQPAASNKRIVIRTIVTTLLTIAVSAFVTLYGQRVVDMTMAAQYQPSDKISSVNERLDLTSRGTDLFYASKPAIQGAETFNANCQSQERTTAILGCYYKSQIYLYDIQNQNLDGTLEVTAAHEMLHAAYERLNFIEKIQVDKMIERQYEVIKNDSALKKTMEYYRTAEPNDLVNELHSILGTTVVKLNPDLESYYGQYFSDRQDIVKLNEKYNAIFGEVSKKAEELSVKIKAMEPEIQAELATYDADRAQMELDIESFNQRATSGGFTTQSSFYAARNALMARTAALNARRDAINAKVNEYNAYVEELNNLSVKAYELNKSINGAEAPAGI